MFKNNKPDALKREMTGLCKILGRPDIRTTFSGTGAYTNNKVVNLPALSDNKAIPPSEQMVIRGAQVHETGHVIHTDWAYCKPLMKRMKGSEHFNFNACEDVMTEHLPIKVYQGAKKNLDALNERTLSRENQFYKDHPEKQAARVETWWHEIPYAALQTCRGEMGYENAALTEYLGSLCPELVKAVKKYVKPLLGATDTRENMKISRRMNKEIAKLQAEYDAAREEDEEEEEDDIMPPPPPPPYDDEPEPIIEGDDEQVEEDEEDGDGDNDDGDDNDDDNDDTNEGDDDGDERDDDGDEDGDGGEREDDRGDDDDGEDEGDRGDEQDDGDDEDDIVGDEGDDGDDDDDDGDGDSGEGGESDDADDDGGDDDEDVELVRDDEGDDGDDGDDDGDDGEEDEGDEQDGDAGTPEVDGDDGGSGGHTAKDAAERAEQAIKDVFDQYAPSEDEMDVIVEPSLTWPDLSSWVNDVYDWANGSPSGLAGYGSIFRQVSRQAKDTIKSRDRHSHDLNRWLTSDLRAYSGKLARLLMAQEDRRMVGGHLEGRIDPRAFGQLVAGADNIFAHEEVTRTDDVIVTVAVDHSGSMDFSSTMKAMIALCDCLNRANVSFEVLSWAGICGVLHDRMPHEDWHLIPNLNFLIEMKREGERYNSPRVQRELGRFLAVGGDTPTLAAIKAVYSRISAHSQTRKVVLFLTDGDPNDRGAEKRMCRKNIDAIWDDGIEFYGVGIGMDVDQMFGPNRSVTAQSGELGKTLLGELERLLLKSGGDRA